MPKWSSSRCLIMSWSDVPSLVRELREHRPVIRGAVVEDARADYRPPGIGEDVVEPRVHDLVRGRLRIPSEFQRIGVKEPGDLRAVRCRVEVAGEDVRIAAGLHVRVEASELQAARLAV